MAVVAVVLALGVEAVASHFSWPQWLVSAPSLAATFALVYWLFDRYLWKLPILNTLGLVKVTDISGIYDGTLTSTFQDATGQAIQRAVTLKVVQSWTRMCVEMAVTSGSSSSLSTSALGSMSNDGAAACVTYVYKNRVNPGVADADMGDHDGAADLRIYDDGHLTGRYFNSRPRAGTIDGQRRP
ncbi:MAG: hypothetical protein AB1673_15470 [Actinomycetota bacterium]